MRFPRHLLLSFLLIVSSVAFADERMPYFVVEVSQEEPVVGEPVVYSVYLYSPTSDVSYIRPISGSDFGDCEARVNVGTMDAHFVGKEIVDNEPWFVALASQIVLFPMKKGNITLKGQQFAVGIEEPVVAYDPFWGEVMSSQTREHTLESDNVKIRVKDIKAEKPSDYCRAIGDFQIGIYAPQMPVERGKDFQIVLTLDGVGSLEDFQLPDLEPYMPEGMKVVSKRNDDAWGVDGNQVLSRTKCIVSIVPSAAGTHIIPEIPITYYNPKLSQFVTVETTRVEITVQPAAFSEDYGPEIFV